MTMYEREQALQAAGYRVAGCDEVGRGPLAGPLVAAAAMLPLNRRIEGLADSKTLGKAARERLSREILDACEVAVFVLPPEEVDRLNVLRASQVAMLQAIERLDCDYVLSDALSLPTDLPQEAIVKGDAKSASIAAASIVAKVHRDRIMAELSTTYPGYGFERNMGYPTREHLKALERLGVTPVHRRSYAPVKRQIARQQTLALE